MKKYKNKPLFYLSLDAMKNKGDVRIFYHHHHEDKLTLWKVKAFHREMAEGKGKRCFTKDYLILIKESFFPKYYYDTYCGRRGIR